MHVGAYWALTIEGMVLMRVHPDRESSFLSIRELVGCTPNGILSGSMAFYAFPQNACKNGIISFIRIPLFAPLVTSHRALKTDIQHTTGTLYCGQYSKVHMVLLPCAISRGGCLKHYNTVSFRSDDWLRTFLEEGFPWIVKGGQGKAPRSDPQARADGRKAVGWRRFTASRGHSERWLCKARRLSHTCTCPHALKCQASTAVKWATVHASGYMRVEGVCLLKPRSESETIKVGGCIYDEHYSVFFAVLSDRWLEGS